MSTSVSDFFTKDLSDSFDIVINNIQTHSDTVISIAALLIGIITVYLMLKPTKVIVVKGNEKTGKNNKKLSPKATPKNKPEPTPKKNWFTIKATSFNNEITFEKDLNNKYTVQLNELPNSHNHPAWKEIAATLFKYQDIKEAFSNTDKSEPVRLRIMTDDSALALLPWHCLVHPETDEHLMKYNGVIEVSPVQHAHTGFYSLTINNPLVIIPIDKEHKIAGDKHYAQIQGYLESHFQIKGAITRFNTAKQLHRELKTEQPDLLYLYAQAEDGRILLDQDSNGENNITMEQLGNWLKEAKLSPVIILTLISNRNITEYPKTLIDNSSLVWVLAATHPSKIPALEQQLFNVIEKLPGNPDISALINQQNDHKQRQLQSILWNSYQTPKLIISHTEQRRKQQFRIALLRTVLGREALKDQISGGVGRSINNTPMLVYAVSGTASTCPFDVPSQVQNQLQYINVNKFPVISYYFNIQISPEPDSIEIENSISDAIDYGIRIGSSDPAEVIQHEITRRAYENQECCIAFNWFFELPQHLSDQAAEKLSEWIHQWINALCEEFSHAVPDKALLIHALCLQFNSQEDAQYAHKIVNKSLRLDKQQKNSKASCNIKFLRIADALGKLEETEISNFFETNQHWQKNLRLNEANIDYYDFAEWIHQKTQGDFDKVINTIWHQYQNNYRQFRESIAV